MNKDPLQLRDATHFNPPLPHRMLGLLMCLCSLAGLLIMAFSLLGLTSDDPDSRQFGFKVLIVGAAVTVLMLIPGLYYVTRYLRVQIDPTNVIVLKGWLFFRSENMHMLMDYQGLIKGKRQMSPLDKRSMSSFIIVLISMFNVVFYMASQKTVTAHTLRLKYEHDKKADVLLACDESIYAITNRINELAEYYQLQVLNKRKA